MCLVFALFSPPENHYFFKVSGHVMCRFLDVQYVMVYNVLYINTPYPIYW